MTENRTWRRWFSWIPSYKVAALTLGLTFGAVAWLTATSGLAALLLAVALLIVAAVLGLFAYWYFLPPRGWKRGSPGSETLSQERRGS
jgi:hypothetical protein